MLRINHLPNRIDGEKIVKIIRKDLFILFKKILGLLILSLLPLIFIYILFAININIINGDFSYPLLILGISAYYLFIWVFFFFSFIDYYLDVWIITNKRIIDIEQKGFFSRIISEQKLFRVQDITSEAHGIFPTILRYGNVHIQTAGTKQRFFFKEVPNPNEIRNIIIKLVEKNKKEQKGLS